MEKRRTSVCKYIRSYYGRQGQSPARRRGAELSRLEMGLSSIFDFESGWEKRYCPGILPAERAEKDQKSEA